MSIKIQGNMPDAAGMEAAQNAETASFCMNSVEKRVQAAMASGKTFDEAVRSISASPALPPPAAAPSGKHLEEVLSFMPSTMGHIFALINEVADNMRRFSVQNRIAQSEAMVEKMRDEAEEIHVKGRNAMIFGLVNAGVGIAGGLASFGVAVHGSGGKTSTMPEGAQPAAQPAAQPVVQPAPQPAVQPAPQPAVQPAPQPAAQPAPRVDAGSRGMSSGSGSVDVEMGGMPAGRSMSVGGGSANAEGGRLSVSDRRMSVSDRRSSLSERSASAESGRSVSVDDAAQNARDTLNAVRAQKILMKYNAISSLISTSANSTQSGLSGGGQHLQGLSDEVIKLQEADVEKIRAFTESLRSLEDSMKQLIQKSLQSAEAIQQSGNQARQKIMG